MVIIVHLQSRGDKSLRLKGEGFNPHYGNKITNLINWLLFFKPLSKKCTVVKFTKKLKFQATGLFQI
jgi:hypothetical protein